MNLNEQWVWGEKEKSGMKVVRWLPMTSKWKWGWVAVKKERNLRSLEEDEKGNREEVVPVFSIENLPSTLLLSTANKGTFVAPIWREKDFDKMRIEALSRAMWDENEVKEKRG